MISLRSHLRRRVATLVRGAHVLLVAMCAVHAVASNAAGAPPPIAAFFRDADIASVQLSPSGRWLAMTTLQGGTRRALAVVDLTGEKPPIIAASLVDADVNRPRWVNDDRLIFSAIDLHRGLGDQKFGPGLYVVGRDGSGFDRLINGGAAAMSTGTHIHTHEPLSAAHGLLALLPGGGNDIIVGEYVFDQQGDLQGINAMRLDVVTHHLTPLSQGRPDHAMEWLFDPHGEPRAIVARNAGRVGVWWRAPGKTEWARLADFPSLKVGFDPLYVDGAGQLFVSVPEGDRGTDVIKRFDFAAGRPEAAAIVSTPGFDAGDALQLDEAGAGMIGVDVETDAHATIWFDPRMKALQALVDAKLQGRVNEITCRKCDTTGSVLVSSWSDQDPGQWWIYWPTDKKWQSVGSARRDIDPHDMAQLDFHRVHARDGEDLPVWVTMPRMAKNAPPPPAVVLVHGGPMSRGATWGWNAQAQFLASRGYAVIQPEFRGSLGYGSAHEIAGRKQWGGAMQDDLADAVAWAASQKLIDPKRVCIAGGSYGGYAALMGPIRHPDTYRCAVAWAAVTDPRLMYENSWVNDMDEEGRRYDLPLLVGDLVKDAAALAKAAPVEHAAELRVPVLLAFGGEDRRVPLKHGTQMRDALHAAGHDPEWVVYPDEGHGWLQVETNLDFWARVERFLAQNDR